MPSPAAGAQHDDLSGHQPRLRDGALAAWTRLRCRYPAAAPEGARVNHPGGKLALFDEGCPYVRGSTRHVATPVFGGCPVIVASSGPINGSVTALPQGIK